MNPDTNNSTNHASQNDARGDFKGELEELTHEDYLRLKSKFKRYSVLLDDAFTVPGTNIKMGWDAIIGLIPGIGDGIGALLSSVTLYQGFRLNLPKRHLLKMLSNIGIEALIGIIPAIGDFFDVAWRANRKNYAILDRHIDQKIALLEQQKERKMKDITPQKDELS